MTKELIGKLRELSDRVFHGDTEPGDFRIIDRAADALVARQPTEDDREAIAKALCEGADTCWNDLTEQELVWHYRDAESVLAAGFSRAAVPDAATERVTENSVRHVKRLTTELQNKRESLNDQRREFRKLLAKARSECDAALAVVERIRQVVSGHPECDRYEEGDVISCGWKSAYASVVAALDGAPEPEVKP